MGTANCLFFAGKWDFMHLYKLKRENENRINCTWTIGFSLNLDWEMVIGPPHTFSTLLYNTPPPFQEISGLETGKFCYQTVANVDLVLSALCLGTFFSDYQQTEIKFDTEFNLSWQ